MNRCFHASRRVARAHAPHKCCYCSNVHYSTQTSLHGRSTSPSENTRFESAVIVCSHDGFSLRLHGTWHVCWLLCSDVCVLRSVAFCCCWAATAAATRLSVSDYNCACAAFWGHWHLCVYVCVHALAERTFADSRKKHKKQNAREKTNSCALRRPLQRRTTRIPHELMAQVFVVCTGWLCF